MSAPDIEALVEIGRYRRELDASLERLLENALDWEHLPWLHASSFTSIELVESSDSHWRARVGMQPRGEVATIELCLDRDANSWTTSTLDGRGAGQEIRTRTRAIGQARCSVDVGFYVAGLAPDARRALGSTFEAIYARLYDEDEAMMVGRQRGLDEARHDAAPGRSEAGSSLRLGSEPEIRTRLPLHFEIAGGRYRLIASGETLRAHALRCPHWLAPLDGASVENGELVCPWHGYRFALDDGRATHPPGARCRLAPAPRIDLDTDGVVHAVWEPSRAQGAATTTKESENQP